MEKNVFLLKKVLLCSTSYKVRLCTVITCECGDHRLARDPSRLLHVLAGGGETVLPWISKASPLVSRVIPSLKEIYHNHYTLSAQSEMYAAQEFATISMIVDLNLLERC